MAPLDVFAAVDAAAGIRETAGELNARYGGRDAAALVEIALRDLFPGRVALVSLRFMPRAAQQRQVELR